MKRIYFILSLLCLIVLMALAVGAADVTVEADDLRQFEASGSIFYLPSYISPSKVRLVHDGTKEISYTAPSGEQVLIQSGDNVDLTPFKATEEDGKTVYTLKILVNNENTRRLTFYFANNLPSVHVETSMGWEALVSTNGKDTSSQVTIINKDGTYEYIDSTNASQIKVRGNATKAYAKKPFQIKLDTKADLYGMGESKTWILLANYDDQSNIRNHVMYKIAEMMGMHSCEFKTVDLYLDGQYYGVFMLCEKVSISSARVDIVELEKLNDALNPTYAQESVSGGSIPDTVITEYTYIPGVVNPADITGGYLVELDNNYWKGELCYFITSYGSHYVVKSPEYVSKEQMIYIATLFGEMEEAIMSKDGYNRLGKHYTEYIELDSLAYAYIMAELGRNYDAGSSSMYFYKDADVGGVMSKIVKGPLWDCDNTLGNIHKNGASNPEGYWARNRSIWGGLIQHEEFNKKVTETLADMYDRIFDMIDAGGYIDLLVNEIGQSIHMERARWHSDDYSQWPVYYDGTHYDRWQPQAPIFNFIDGYYSYGNDEDESTVIGYLCEHIEARVNWLAKEWGCDVTLRERSFENKKSLAILLVCQKLIPFTLNVTEVQIEAMLLGSIDHQAAVSAEPQTSPVIYIDAILPKKRY